MSGEKEPIKFDEVVSIEIKPFNNYVYNIETTENYYFANGIATHNCRCVMVPVLKSWRELGIDLDEAPEGTRASMDGQVPESITYNQWLRTQDQSDIEEALGKTRAKLFMDGNLSVTSFTDRKGRSFTLEELMRREKDAFDAAGVGV